MRRRVVTTPEADADIADAYEWYAALRPELGTDFLAELAVTFMQLEQFPEAHAVIRGETRRAILKRFPYSVFHIVDPDAVTVTGVLHFRRDPQVWPLRLPRSEP